VILPKAAENATSLLELFAVDVEFDDKFVLAMAALKPVFEAPRGGVVRGMQVLL
jgi:hypothetical protein